MSDETTAPSPVANESAPPWPLIGFAAAICLLFIWWGWRTFGPRPALGPALTMYASGRYAEAERKLAEFLAYDPKNPTARLTLADVLINVDPPKPLEALKVLEGFESNDLRQVAAASVLRGKAERTLYHPAQAEAHWKEARKLDPDVGEAGWLLLQLYYDEGRNEELRKLALRLHKREPEPNDRVRLLLEPMRPDAEPLAAAGVVPMFKDAVKNNPDDIYAALAYYRALAKDGTGIEEALKGLNELVERHPKNLACIDGLLFAQASVGDLEGMSKMLASLPADLAANSRLARYRGWLSQNRRAYAEAIKEYQKALEADPSNAELLHRLGESYKLAGKAKEAEATKAREASVETARKELRGIKGQDANVGQIGLFEDASRRPNLGKTPDIELYKKLADVRLRMGHPDEAVAWYSLVLQETPADPDAREAIERIQKAAEPASAVPGPAANAAAAASESVDKSPSTQN